MSQIIPIALIALTLCGFSGCHGGLLDGAVENPLMHFSSPRPGNATGDEPAAEGPAAHEGEDDAPTSPADDDARAAPFDPIEEGSSIDEAAPLPPEDDSNAPAREADGGGGDEGEPDAPPDESDPEAQSPSPPDEGEPPAENEPGASRIPAGSLDAIRNILRTCQTPSSRVLSADGQPTSDLPFCIVGAPCRHQFSMTGGSEILRWQIDSWQPEVSGNIAIDPGTGLLDGTIAQAGNYSVSVAVQDRLCGGNTRRAFTLKVIGRVATEVAPTTATIAEGEDLRIAAYRLGNDGRTWEILGQGDATDLTIVGYFTNIFKLSVKNPQEGDVYRWEMNEDVRWTGTDGLRRICFGADEALDRSRYCSNRAQDIEGSRDAIFYFRVGATVELHQLQERFQIRVTDTRSVDRSASTQILLNRTHRGVRAFLRDLRVDLTTGHADGAGTDDLVHIEFCDADPRQGTPCSDPIALFIRGRSDHEQGQTSSFRPGFFRERQNAKGTTYIEYVLTELVRDVKNPELFFRISKHDESGGDCDNTTDAVWNDPTTWGYEACSSFWQLQGVLVEYTVDVAYADGGVATVTNRYWNPAVLKWLDQDTELIFGPHDTAMAAVIATGNDGTDDNVRIVSDIPHAAFTRGASDDVSSWGPRFERSTSSDERFDDGNFSLFLDWNENDGYNDFEQRDVTSYGDYLSGWNNFLHEFYWSEAIAGLHGNALYLVKSPNGNDGSWRINGAFLYLYHPAKFCDDGFPETISTSLDAQLLSGGRNNLNGRSKKFPSFSTNHPTLPDGTPITPETFNRIGDAW